MLPKNDKQKFEWQKKRYSCIIEACYIIEVLSFKMINIQCRHTRLALWSLILSFKVHLSQRVSLYSFFQINFLSQQWKGGLKAKKRNVEIGDKVTKNNLRESSNFIAHFFRNTKMFFFAAMHVFQRLS